MATFDEGILNVSKPENCGCQDLLTKISLVHHGWLRRKGLRNSLQIKFIKWPQQYVIIGEKCLYYFSHEVSKHPEGAVSLYGFNKVIRASDIKISEAPWAFKLEHIQPHMKSIYFAASSEKEMVIWMKAFKAEMLIANNMKSNSFKRFSENSADSSWDSGDYRVLEESIYMEPVMSRISHTDEGEDSDFSDIAEDTKKPTLPPRPSFRKVKDMELTQPSQTDKVSEINKRLSSVSSSYSIAKQYPSDDWNSLSSLEIRTKQQRAPDSEEARRNSDCYWESAFFHGTKNEAAGIISRIAENGVYLIRKSDDQTKVLLFYLHTGIKKFRIIEKEYGKVSLAQSGPDFKTIESLLSYYYDNELPSVHIKLVTPYKLHSKYQE